MEKHSATNQELLARVKDFCIEKKLKAKELILTQGTPLNQILFSTKRMLRGFINYYGKEIILEKRKSENKILKILFIFIKASETLKLLPFP